MTRVLLFKRMNNALFDMQASTSQTFEEHFQTFARLISDASLQSLNQQLISGLDVEQLLEESYKTQGGMRGSARLVWPVEVEKVLGLKWLLIQKLAREPSKLVDFSLTFYTVGHNLTGELHSLTRQLLIPFGRDYKEFVMMVDNSDAGKPRGLENSTTSQYITYNMSGTNARVNNHSTDNSINTVSSTDVSIYIQQLRDEIQCAAITTDQKFEAVEVVEEIELQVASKSPKKSIMRVLLASLPAVESITNIGKNLYDVLYASV